MREPRDGTGTSSRSFSLVPFALLGAFTLDTVLYGIVIPFLPGRVLGLGENEAVVGILFASYAMGLLLATPLAGWLTNRFGGRRILGVGLLLLLASTLVFAFSTTVPMLFVARTLQGVAGAMPWTAGLALIAGEYSGPERHRRFTQVFSATGVGTLIGPALGGVLYTWRGFQAPFLCMALLIFIESVATIAIFSRRGTVGARTLPKPIPQETSSIPAGDRARTTAQLLKYPPFVEALLLTSAGALLLALLEPSLPVLLAGRYGLTPLAIGLVFASMTIVFIVVQGLVGAFIRHYSAAAALFFGLTMGPLSLLLLGVSITLVHAAVALALLAFSFAFLLSPALEYLTLTAQPVAAHRAVGGLDEASVPYGTLYASYNLAYSVGVLLGPILVGVAITTLGQSSGLIVTGSVLIVVFSPLAFRTVQSARRQTRNDTEKRAPGHMEAAHHVMVSGLVTTRSAAMQTVVVMVEVIEAVEIVATEELIEIDEIDIVAGKDA